MTTKHYPYVLSCDWFAFSCLSTWAEAQGYYPSRKEKPSLNREGLPVLSGSYYDYLFRPVLRDGKNAFIERKVGDVITYKHYEFPRPIGLQYSLTAYVRLVGDGWA